VALTPDRARPGAATRVSCSTASNRRSALRQCRSARCRWSRPGSRRTAGRGTAARESRPSA